MKYSTLAIVFLIILQITARWTIYDLNQELKTEKSARIAAIAERDEALARAESLAENAKACLEREAFAIEAACERAKIMDDAKPRKRTKNENVVDNETRRRVADRLNRPL